MKNKIRWDNLAIVLMLSGVGIGIIASCETRIHQIHGVDPGYWPWVCIAGFSPMVILCLLQIVGFVVPDVGRAVFGSDDEET